MEIFLQFFKNGLCAKMKIFQKWNFSKLKLFKIRIFSKNNLCCQNNCFSYHWRLRWEKRRPSSSSQWRIKKNSFIITATSSFFFSHADGDAQSPWDKGASHQGKVKILKFSRSIETPEKLPLLISHNIF